MGIPAGNGRIVFDGFELDTDRRTLSRGGELLPLRGKAFELLLALIENRDKVATKEFLLETIWEGQFVEENNLTVHIAAIRKALGERKGQHRYIVTVPGKGYRFVGDAGSKEHGEITVETHEIRNIVIEEEYEIDEAEIPPKDVRNLKAATRSGRWTWAAMLVFLLIAGGGWILYSRSQGVLTRSGSPPMTARIFSVSGGVPQRVVISPDGSKIAYSSRTNGKDALWIGDLESNSSIPITQPIERLHNALQFSPDGRTIYFTALDNNHRVWTLMAVSSSGGAIRDLGIEANGDIAISPDGKQLAHFARTKDNSWELYVREASDGANPRRMFDPSGGQTIHIPYVAWSPSGSSLTVWAADAEQKSCRFVEVYTSDGSTRTFGQGPCDSVSNFEWTSKGTEMVITESLSDDARRAQLRLLDRATGEKRELTNDAFHYMNLSLSTSLDGRVASLEVRNLLDISTIGVNGDPRENKILRGGLNNEGAHGLAATPDGKVIYTVKVGSSRAIWEVNPDGTGARELVKPGNAREDMQPSVSADDRFLVFDSNRTGELEVWRANRDGTGAVALTSGGDNSESTITPDGRYVVYRAAGSGANGIWKIPIEGGTPERLISEDCSWPDLSPDGRFIACATGRNDEGPKRRLRIYRFDGGFVKEFAVTSSSILYNRLRWASHGGSVLYKDVVDGLWEQPLDGTPPGRIAGFDSIRVFHFGRGIGGEILYSGGTQGRNIVILEPAYAPKD